MFRNVYERQIGIRDVANTNIFNISVKHFLHWFFRTELSSRLSANEPTH